MILSMADWQDDEISGLSTAIRAKSEMYSTPSIRSAMKLRRRRHPSGLVQIQFPQ
jgi:hypothetical protein